MTVKLLVDRPIDGKEYKAGNLCDTDDSTEAGLISSKLAIANLTGGTAYVAPVEQVQIVPVMASKTLTGGIELSAGGAVFGGGGRPKDFDSPNSVVATDLAIERQTVTRLSATELAVLSKSGGAKILRVLRYNVFTALASAGVASQFWRLTRLIELDGAVFVGTAAPSSAGGYTSAARNLHPDTTNGGQAVSSGVIYNTSAQNDAIEWSVTVPPSGIVQCLMLASSGAAQSYTVACGGKSKAGTLIQSTTAGLLPQAITLYGCTTGAQTLTVTKTTAAGVMYTAGPCIDPDVATPSADGSLIYWFAPTARLIDGSGANDLALNIGGTFYGSYHGGHYGSTVFSSDGAAIDFLTGGPIYSCGAVSVTHAGRVGDSSITSVTTLYADGHTINMALRADNLVMTEAHVLMAGALPDMSIFNGVGTPATSQYITLDTSAFVDMATPGRSKAITARLESCRLNGIVSAGNVSHVINTGGYCKGYVTVPTPLPVSALDVKAIWAY